MDWYVKVFEKGGDTKAITEDYFRLVEEFDEYKAKSEAKINEIEK